MIRVGDEFWQYYGGSPLTHHEVALPFLIKHEHLIFSRVVSRLDGYVSVEADVKGGHFITLPLTYAGNQLNSTLRPVPAAVCGWACSTKMTMS